MSFRRDALPSTPPPAGGGLPTESRRASERPPEASKRPSQSGALADIPLEQRQVAGLPLALVEGFPDLPTQAQRLLTERAVLHELTTDGEIPLTGGAVLVEGAAFLCSSVSDAAALQIPLRRVIPALATLADAVRTRVVAIEPTRLIVWDRATLEDVLGSCPWILDELRATSNRLSATAGATLGILGDLDESSRTALLDRLSLVELGPDAPLAQLGDPLPGLLMVGGGMLIVDGEEGAPYVPGAVVTVGGLLRHADGQERILTGTLRAGSGGALLLRANEELANELLSSHPGLEAILR